ncbi:hypothetical protein E1B28_005743 [Marasmius oreades]|uniref:A-kinase anchor protein 7-like phosphoesterase domain-containing protein n=1 Tax=Marasmius oreades TaxID=181124 RepID=A0A9P7S599_9AGAR|nr:uncharacterized protein E1B28_005743 [Marasmius oreades]KAG7094941.1 hypothetical protein E1B28_005743 [Marasmius oreades]
MNQVVGCKLKRFIRVCANGSTSLASSTVKYRRRSGGNEGSSLATVEAWTKPLEQKKGISMTRPTHFLSLPLGQHSQLRGVVGNFQSALLLLQKTPDAIKGLDPSIVINPRRLHLTLGVMTLEKSNEHTADSEKTSKKTIESALELLHSLQPQLSNEGPLEVPLKRLGVFESKKGARVLWVSPIEQVVDEETPEEKENREKLQRVCDLVHRTFKAAGYITDQRPLKLHCTIINTSYRKPSSKRHILFSFDDILRSAPLRSIQAFPTTTQVAAVEPVATSSSLDPSRDPATIPCAIQGSSGTNPPSEPASIPTERVIPVDMGTFTVSEIQLCVMGSHGPEDEYVSVGGTSLTKGN